MLGIVTVVTGGLVLVMLMVLFGMFVVDTVKWTRQGLEAYRAEKDAVEEWDRLFGSR